MDMRNTVSLLKRIFPVMALLLLFQGHDRQLRENRERLKTVSYLYDVEKLLFVAHQKEENITLALRRVALMTRAQAAFFCTLDPSFYLWCRNEHLSRELGALLNKPTFYRAYFENSKRPLLSYHPAERPDSAFAGKNWPSLPPLRGLTAVPIRDTSGRFVGVLGAANPNRHVRTSELLENVAPSFAMLCHNIRSHHLIRKLGETDALTGLKNRNCFEKELAAYPSRCRGTVTCLYMDVNGLHELNNTQGHAAGDRLLQLAAKALQKGFGAQNSYRIGGDEFVAFALDMPEEALSERTRQILRDIEQSRCFAAVGVCTRHFPCASPGPRSVMEELLKAAEQDMYREKAAFYAAREGRAPRRNGGASYSETAL